MTKQLVLSELRALTAVPASCLVACVSDTTMCKQACGHRELLDHETAGQVAGDSVDFLHVFVKLSDVKSLNATGASSSRVSFDYQHADRPSPRSALTASLEQEHSSTESPRWDLAAQCSPALEGLVLL